MKLEEVKGSKQPIPQAEGARELEVARGSTQSLPQAEGAREPGATEESLPLSKEVLEKLSSIAIGLTMQFDIALKTGSAHFWNNGGNPLTNYNFKEDLLRTRNALAEARKKAYLKVKEGGTLSEAQKVIASSWTV